MVNKLTVSQTRRSLLQAFSAMPLCLPFLLWSQGAKCDVIDAVNIFCIEKACHWQSSLRAPFLRSSPQRVPDPSRYVVRLREARQSRTIVREKNSHY